MPLPQINFEGRIATEPVVRFTKSGAPMTTFRAVASDNKKNLGGGWDTVAELWVNVVIFHEPAEWVVKGAKFHAYGRLESREYETNDGQKRQTIELKTKFLTQNAPSIPYVSPTSNAPEVDPWATMPKPLDDGGDNVPF